MKYITEFRRPELAEGLILNIRNKSRTPARLMEFCGGHTVVIFRYGIRQVLPSTIEMVASAAQTPGAMDEEAWEQAEEIVREAFEDRTVQVGETVSGEPISGIKEGEFEYTFPAHSMTAMEFPL